MAKRQTRQRGKVEFFPATAERWDDLERLFGERGACGGCWCMTWRLPRKDFERGKAGGNRRALKRIVAGDESPGVLAYSGGEAIGWCAVAPRQVYVALERSRVLAAVDEQPVWSISCLFVAKPWRRQGLSARLIDAAVNYAKSHGAKVVEGYPSEPYSQNVPAAFAWTGMPAAFEKAGFVEVARRSKARPIMRRALGKSRLASKKRDGA